MVIAAFDFDGTLTYPDTLMVFLKHVFTKKQLAIGLARLSLVLTAFKFKLISNNLAKQKLFAYFFGGMDLAKFNEYCATFTVKIPPVINPTALARLKWHQDQGHTCVIVSASVENWIKPWADQYNVTVASTRLEVIDGKITGRFLGENCYGDEKVTRLLELFPNRETYELYAYGDSGGDRALLALADHSFYRKFE
jgi:phosphatidylglycerophosphatase C